MGRRLAGPLRDAWSSAADGGLDILRARRPDLPNPTGVTVVLDGIASIPARPGWVVEAAYAGHVQVFVPYRDLGVAASLPGVVMARAPFRAAAKSVTTEGYAEIMDIDWRAAGIDGAGVKVGIVDVGFAGIDNAGDEVAVPTDEDFSRGSSNTSAHGVAVAEVIHDFAPAAEIFVATFSTDVEFGQALQGLVANEVDVINGSVGFDNVWHADGTSAPTTYADQVIANDVIYVAAAGNENDKYRVGPLADAGDGLVSIAAASEAHCTAPAGFVHVSFRWSEPFGKAKQDLDLVLLNEDGSECGRSASTQAGSDYPFEEVSASGCSSSVSARVIKGDAADLTDLEGYLYCFEGLAHDEWTDTEDLTLPGDNFDGVTVGAYTIEDDAIAYYSSRGPTNDGRSKPDVVAPTAVTTATFGPRGFAGSSASAPHAAGLAALWVEANGKADPSAFKAWLTAGARDLGDDADTFGAGAIRAGDVPPRDCGCNGLGEAGSPAKSAGFLAGLACATLARRRCR